MTEELTLREIEFTITEKGKRAKEITLITTLLDADAFTTKELERVDAILNLFSCGMTVGHSDALTLSKYRFRRPATPLLSSAHSSPCSLRKARTSSATGAASAPSRSSSLAACSRP